MLGPILIVLAVAIVIPVGFLMSMGGVAGLIGWLLGSEVDGRYEDDDEQLVLSRTGHSITKD